MASEKLDIVCPIYEAWDRGDFSSAEWAHPEIEFVMPDGVSPTQAKGIAEMAAAWRSVLSAWTDFSVKAEAYREIDETRVLVLTCNRGRGKSSGVDVGEIARGANILHIQNGKVTRLVAYWERDHAFADLALPTRASPG